MTTFMTFNVVSGLLLVLLALPLLFERVPPNAFYGFRISPALDDPKVWYATNRYSAKWLIGAGACVSVAAVVLAFVPGITLDAYALGCLAVFAVVFVAGFVQSVRYMNALARRESTR